MKKTLFHILILVLLSNCRNKAQSENDLNVLKKKEVVEIKKEEITFEKQTEQKPKDYQDINDNETDSIVRNIFMVAKNPKLIDAKHKLNYQNISENDFLNFKKSYDYKIVEEKLIQQDSIKFLIKSNNKVYELNNGFGNAVYPISDFYGYIKPLNSYIIGSGGKGIYNMFLLNKKTDSVVNLTNHTDGNDNFPRISPNNNKLISFETDYAETFINIYHIKNETIISYSVYINTKWNIDDIIWIDNDNIALKVCDNFKYEYSNNQENCLETKYLKSRIE